MSTQTPSPDTPEFVVPPQALVPVNGYPAAMMPIPPSKMFLIKKSLATFRERYPDRPVYDASQGDGGASLPGVPPEVLDRAHQLQREHGTGYDMPYGCDLFRQAVVEHYWQLDSATGWGPANIIAAQGGRDALEKVYQAMLFLGHGRIGDVIVVSRVPWISYNWGPYGVGANVMLAPGREEEGWAYTEEGIAACVEVAERHGRKVAALIVTSPDNPTGHTLSLEQQVALGKAALRLGIPFVLYDWIYHRVTDEEPMDLNRFLLAFEPEEREHLIILDGITKSLGASNIRNAHLVAPERVIRFIQSRASHGVIPSFYSQAVAIAAYEMGFDRAAATIVEPTNASRAVLRRFFQEHGLTAILGKGYYAFINVAPWLEKAGMEDSAVLGQYLAEEHGLAIVPGVYFSRHGARWIRFSYALPPERTQAAAQRLLEGLQALAR